VAEAASQDNVIMKAKLAIIILGALVVRPMAQMHNIGPVAKLTFGICRKHSGEPTDMRGAKYRNTNHREAFTNRLHKEINRILIRIENFM
jgi:hypothetical protein